MAQVEIIINERSYRIGCQDGEEPQILSLAQGIETRLQELKKVVGARGEGYLLVVTALSLADELADMRQALANPLRTQPGQQAAAPTEDTSGDTMGIASVHLHDLARRIDAVVARLDQS